MKKGEGKEMEKKWSDIRLATEELSLVNPEEKNISTLAFLGVSNLVLQVLDKIGPSMLVLRQDIQRNIERVEELYLSDPTLYSSLVDILKEEAEGSIRKTESCTKAVVWLTRSIDFGVTLLGKLEKDPSSSLEQAVEEAYKNTLKPWHGWISSAAYKVALKLVPEREIFISLLMGEGQDYGALKEDIMKLVTMLQPLLDETYTLLRTYRLDRLKST
ncbi:glycolipid transfer protein 3 [Elaeis guineensis]|uniref:Glycolipid transfer protein 3 isoform X2 n=1 Tax=Elaeis guineensis var. tenera TaxID=51953 RepID=A0A6I9QQL2_ELAGV|nr:glycolipid transfer protein 3 isoform X2 [Elaeis guineensis]